MTVWTVPPATQVPAAVLRWAAHGDPQWVCVLISSSWPWPPWLDGVEARLPPPPPALPSRLYGSATVLGRPAHLSLFGYRGLSHGVVVGLALLGLAAPAPAHHIDACDL